MATYIVLASFTDQGIRDVKNTVKRAQAVKTAGKKFGVDMKSIYWTHGQHDMVVVFEAKDEKSVTAFGLAIGSQGNIRSQTMRAFNTDEMGEIVAKLG
jgi:uncharacterized protein with GYD domain